MSVDVEDAQPLSFPPSSHPPPSSPPPLNTHMYRQNDRLVAIDGEDVQGQAANLQMAKVHLHVCERVHASECEIEGKRGKGRGGGRREGGREKGGEKGRETGERGQELAREIVYARGGGRVCVCVKERAREREHTQAQTRMPTLTRVHTNTHTNIHIYTIYTHTLAHTHTHTQVNGPEGTYVVLRLVGGRTLFDWMHGGRRPTQRDVRLVRGGI